METSPSLSDNLPDFFPLFFYEHKNIPEWLLSLLVTREIEKIEKTMMDEDAKRKGTMGSLIPVMFLSPNPEYRYRTQTIFTVTCHSKS